jgi:hypothetical protein
MQQILPGIYHWTGFDDEVRAPVHSHYVEPAGVLIDPTMPEEGPAAFEGMVTPQQVLLTNRRHFRHSAAFKEVFGCAIRAAAPAMPELEARGVEPFWFGDDVGYGVTAVEIAVVFPEETAVYVSHGPGALAFGDGLVRPAASPLAFPADDVLGNHPDRAKHALKDAFRGLLLRDFDALLFAHGEPVRDDGKAALRKFVQEPTEYAEFGPYA